MKDVSFGQYYPVDSFVHRLDPRLKLLFLIAYIVAIFLASNFYGLAVCAGVLVFIVAFARIPIGKVLRAVKGVVFLVSENFLVSKSVLTETEYAARSGKPFCVPMQGMTVPGLRHSLVLGGLLKQDLGNGEPKQKREWFAKAPAEFKEAFADRSFRYANTTYIAIAGVK